MDNKKRILKEFKDEVIKKYGMTAIDIINKQLLILHKLPEINKKTLINVEEIIKQKMNRSAEADIKRVTVKDKRKSSLNNRLSREHSNIASDSMFANNNSKFAGGDVFSPDKRGDNTMHTTISAGKKLINKSMRTTNVNSPARDLSIDANAINDSESKGPVFPLLQVKTTVSNQRGTNSMNNSLYGKGFRTPIKKYIPIWDAKCIQDSNEFFKEQQMKNLQIKNNKASFKMFLDAQVKQRADREKSNQEITKHDFNNMANSISNKEKREQFMEDQKRK